MSPGTLAVLLAGAAGLVLTGAGPRDAARLGRVLVAPVPGSRGPTRTLVPPPGWVPRAAALGSLVALVTSHGGTATLLAVLAVCLGLPRAQADRARERAAAALARDLPRAADLLAGCLDAGSTLADAVSVVGTAVGGPVAVRLRPVAAVLAAGGELRVPRPGPAPHPADPVDRLLRTLARTAVTGAPLAGTLRELAADERERARWLATGRAQSAGVRAVGPLAVCFLPAFVLVGVVPVVVGVSRVLLTGWA